MPQKKIKVSTAKLFADYKCNQKRYEQVYDLWWQMVDINCYSSDYCLHETTEKVALDFEDKLYEELESLEKQNREIYNQLKTRL